MYCSRTLKKRYILYRNVLAIVVSEAGKFLKYLNV